MTKEFIGGLVKLEKICDHFHLSLQSGCDETLKRMNRRYTAEEFEEGIKIIRENFPNVSLTTDVIVGFPGETGTKAAVMPNQITGEIKEKRSNKLIELSNKNQEEQNKKYIGKEIEVLFEEQEGEYIKGHTTNYIMVYVKSENKDLEDTIKKVKITGTVNEHLIGICN